MFNCHVQEANQSEQPEAHLLDNQLSVDEENVCFPLSEYYGGKIFFLSNSRGPQSAWSG